MHDRLTRQLSPAHAIDPLTVLPVELVEMVMEHLSFRTMVRCLRVSKGWKVCLLVFDHLEGPSLTYVEEPSDQVPGTLGQYRLIHH